METNGGDTIQDDFIGTDATVIQALGNGGDGIKVESSGNTIGGTVAGAGNVISANGFGSGLHSGVNIAFGVSNLVQGNKIGTDATGTKALGNEIGVLAESSGNTIGGTTAGAGNVISANADGGVGINFGASFNVVQGNKIGTDVTGTQALSNSFLGIQIGGSGNTIGGTTAGAGNVISANAGAIAGDGVDIISSSSASFNVVQGNSIGTDITGTRALGNREVGVFVASSGNTIGGATAGAGNVISANGLGGMNISGPSNLVQGNKIGTDVTGTQALGNKGIGIVVSYSSGNTIGGAAAAGAGNVVSANAGDGVDIDFGASFTAVQGNKIGTDVSGTQALGNGGNGVSIQGAGASNNTIGGMQSGAGNVIAFNGNDGVLVDGGTGNAILSDLIFASGNLGIELINNGNNNQAAPTLLGAFSNESNTAIIGTWQGAPNTTYTVQLFSAPSADANGLGEGQQLLGTITVLTDAFGYAPFIAPLSQPVPPGQIVTATATDSNNDTSEFSAPVVVTQA